MKLIKTEQSTAIAGGNMGTSSKKYIDGTKEYYQYNEDVVIIKYIPRLDLKQDKTITFNAIINGISFFISNNKLNEYKLLEIHNLCFNTELEEIKKTDLSKAKQELEKYNKLFEMEKRSFIEVINDYLSKLIFTKNVKLKLLIEKGYEFKSFSEFKIVN